MLTYLINIAFAIIATVMYIQAPADYNYTYCAAVTGCFVIQNLLYFATNKREHWLGFELFFMLSFFLVNLVYPVFYVPTRPYWSMFSYSFPDPIVTRCTALAYFGYAWYLLGATRLLQLRREEPTEPVFTITMRQYLFFFILTIVSWLLYVATGGLAALQRVYAEGANLQEVGIYSYFGNLFTVGCYLMAIFLFRLPKQKWWFYTIVIMAFVLMLLSTGSRQLAIGITLVLVTSLSLYVYRLRWWQVAGVVLGGSVVLFGVMLFRTEGMDLGAWHAKWAATRLTTFWDIYEDLIVDNLNLFVLVHYADTHALTWLQGMTIDLCSPIPGLGSYIAARADVPEQLLNGGELPTYLILGADATWGTGTNMIGEAYRSFGAAGTALAMLLIGIWVKESYYRANRSVYWYTMYFLLVGHALVYPRAPLLFDPRLVVWSLLLLWVVQSITERRKEKKE